MSHRAQRRTRIIGAVVALAVLAGGTYAYVRSRAASPDESALTATGSVEADTSQVSSVIAGRIESVAASEGARVRRGDTLFTIDDDILYAQVQQAKAGVSAAKAGLRQVADDGGSTAEKAVARARVTQAEQALAMARAQLDYATIRAANDGVITALAVREGENAAPGKSLATLADLERLHVVVYISETDIGKLRVGSTVDVTTDSSDRTFAGRVSFVADEAEFTPSYIETKDQRVKLVYEVRVSIDGGDGVLKPGMPVDVAFE